MNLTHINKMNYISQEKLDKEFAIKMVAMKLASVLDPVQKQLAVDVWDEKMFLRPELKDQILRMLHSVVPKEDVMGVYILGSITGYKYTETSDIDVNIFIKNFDKSLRVKVNQINGFHSYGGRHPVNLFLSPFDGELPRWKDAMYGVYDVLKDDWVNAPPNRENFRDPQIELRMEIDLASSISDEFNRKVNRIKEDVKSLNKLKKFKWAIPGISHWYIGKKRRKLKDRLVDLVQMAKGLEDERKFEYAWGWGTPRKNFRNIVYKLIEHGPNGNLFLDLEKVDLPNQFGDEVKNEYKYKYASLHDHLKNKDDRPDKANYIFNRLVTKK